MKVIEKKCWPEFYQATVDGLKTFEARNDIPDVECGDVLFLREWNPTTGQYTGRKIYKKVTYVLHTKDIEIEEYGLVIMALGNAPRQWVEYMLEQEV